MEFGCPRQSKQIEIPVVSQSGQLVAVVCAYINVYVNEPSQPKQLMLNRFGRVVLVDLDGTQSPQSTVSVASNFVSLGPVKHQNDVN